MTTKDLQHRLKWPITTMMTCIIDNPDFKGQVLTKFNHGGVCAVDVTDKQSKPPKIKDKVKKFIERIFGE